VEKTKTEKPTKSGTDKYVELSKQIREMQTDLDRQQITDQSINRMFSYHKPNDEQVQQIQRIRRACMACAQVVKDNTRGSADQTAAIRLIHEGMMTANKCVVLQGK